MEAYSLAEKRKSDFYIVDTVTSWVIERLTRMANVKEGPGLTKEERLNHAIYLVRVQNMPVESAAKSFYLSAATVQNALETSEVRDRLDRMGFHETLYPSILEDLYRIKLDSVLLESAKLVHEAQMTGEETAELARKVCRASSENAQMAIIANMSRQLHSRRVKTRAGQTRRMLLPSIQLRRGANLINATRAESVKPLEKDLARVLRSARKKIDEIMRDESPF
jgi:hypothetical protein